MVGIPMRRFAPAAVGLALLLCGCGFSPRGSSSQSSVDTSAIAPAEVPSASPPPTPAPTPTPTEFILIASIQRAVAHFDSFSAVSISGVDPATGDVSDVADFQASGNDVVISATYLQMNGSYSATYRSLFAPDLQRAAAIRFGTADDGSLQQHVGWIDRSGSFTDISAKVDTDDDFEATSRDTSPAFDNQGTFWFMRTAVGETEKKMTLYRVTDAASDPDKWRTFTSTNTGMINGYILPYKGKPQLRDSVAFVNFLPYDADHGCYNGNQTFTDGRCVGLPTTNLQRIFTMKAYTKKWVTDQGFMGAGAVFAAGKPLVPQTQRTLSWPVFSPAGTEVAFQSGGRTGAGTRLYKVDSAGGAPKRIEPGDHLLGDSSVILGWEAVTAGS